MDIKGLKMKNILDFIKNNLIEYKYGIPAVLSRTKEDIVTDNYLLIDISLSIISFFFVNEYDKAINIYNEKINNYIDDESWGYHEQIDISGSVNSVSHVRTPKYQALALLAEYICQVKLLGNDNYSRYLERMEWLIHTARKNEWPNVFNRDFSAVIDDAQRLDTISILTISYLMISNDHISEIDPISHKDTISALQNKLGSFITDVGVIAALTGSNKHDKSYGYHLHSSSLAALAWISLYRVGDKSGIGKAYSILCHINNCHYHNNNHGFWNRINYHSKVEVDPISYIYGRVDSPFPIKDLRDHAILAICTKEYLKINHNDMIYQLRNKALSEIYRYTDHEIGGVFHGQGSWFSTPFDATVPLARHVMVKHNTKGSFSVGNTSYVPFNEKHSDTQFLSLVALYDIKEINGIESEKTVIKTPLDKGNLENKLMPASYSKLSSNIIDLPNYIHWLKSTTSGYGFGLTPYRSPLGLRSDKTPQIFSALHVISDFTVLNLKYDNEEALISGINSSQNVDGGFSEQPGLLSEVFTTYCAVLTCVILNKINFDKESCIRFVLNCQHKDGGFGNTPGYPCDVWHTNLAVLTLVALNRRPIREDDLINYLFKCQNNDGGYGNQPNTVSDVFATFRAVSTLLALGFTPPNHTLIIKWLKGLQTNSGGFLYKENGAESFVGSYHAIAALYILNDSPRDSHLCMNYISERQNIDGGFSRRPYFPSETTDEGFIAIQALHMLEKKLNPYWATLIT